MLAAHRRQGRQGSTGSDAEGPEAARTAEVMVDGRGAVAGQGGRHIAVESVA